MFHIVPIIFIVTLVFLFLIANFLRFHLNLVINNNTTLETLKAERDKELITSQYDMGTSNNWEQIFGKHKCLWFLPVESRNEEYDGVNYPRRNYEA